MERGSVKQAPACSTPPSWLVFVVAALGMSVLSGVAAELMVLLWILAIVAAGEQERKAGEH